jgi:hypothetical protein
MFNFALLAKGFNTLNPETTPALSVQEIFS